jgi:hypothetical protein
MLTRMKVMMLMMMTIKRRRTQGRGGQVMMLMKVMMMTTKMRRRTQGRGGQEKWSGTLSHDARCARCHHRAKRARHQIRPTRCVRVAIPLDQQCPVPEKSSYTWVHATVEYDEAVAHNAEELSSPIENYLTRLMNPDCV